MKKTNIVFTILLHIALLSSFLEADNSKHMKKYYVNYKTLNISDELAKSIAFGLTSTTGTTNTLNLNGRFRTFFSFLGINDKTFKILFDSKVYLTKTDNIKNNEEYRVDLDFEQSFDEDWLGYGTLSWFKNTFKNYDAVFYNNIGIGNKILRGEMYSLTLKFGLGYNKEIYSNTQANKIYLSLNQYIEYNYKFTSENHFYTKIALIENIKNFSNDYEMLSILGFDFMLSENFSFSIEQEIYFDALRPEGDETVDTRSVAKIGYRF